MSANPFSAIKDERRAIRRLALRVRNLERRPANIDLARAAYFASASAADGASDTLDSAQWGGGPLSGPDLIDLPAGFGVTTFVDSGVYAVTAMARSTTNMTVGGAIGVTIDILDAVTGDDLPAGQVAPVTAGNLRPDATATLVSSAPAGSQILVQAQNFDGGGVAHNFQVFITVQRLA